MKHFSTNVLRAAVAVIGLVILGLCVFVVPQGITSTHIGGYRPILFGFYVTAIPFFYALYETIKLLGYIDHDKVFSHLSIKALQHIKFAALIISTLFAAGMPYIYTVADKDDSPGVVALSLIIIAASFVIATAAGVFQELMQKAVHLKSENDLTV